MTVVDRKPATTARRPVLRLGKAISFPIHPRTVVVVSILLLVSLALAVWALTLGDLNTTFAQVLGAFTGDDAVPERIRNEVLDWRVPRVLIALAGGACLGLSGAIFQSLTRNPLGSPDIIGFNTGAYTGALVAILILQTGSSGSTIGALIGGLVTAVVVTALAYKGGIGGFRLIVVGIAFSSVLAALNTYLVMTADLDTALAAATWGMGSFGIIGWSDVMPVLIAMVVFGGLLAVMARTLRLLELGDDSAAGLGLNVNRSRLLLIAIGIGFIAPVTAAAGPILFIALAAPQIAHRLTKSAGVPLVGAALMGSMLLLISDIISIRIFAPELLPVGVVTVTVGGIYLIALLVRRSGKA